MSDGYFETMHVVRVQFDELERRDLRGALYHAGVDERRLEAFDRVRVHIRAGDNYSDTAARLRRFHFVRTTVAALLGLETRAVVFFVGRARPTSTPHLAIALTVVFENFVRKRRRAA